MARGWVCSRSGSGSPSLYKTVGVQLQQMISIPSGFSKSLQHVHLAGRTVHPNGSQIHVSGEGNRRLDPGLECE